MIFGFLTTLFAIAGKVLQTRVDLALGSSPSRTLAIFVTSTGVSPDPSGNVTTPVSQFGPLSQRSHFFAQIQSRLPELVLAGDIPDGYEPEPA